MKTLELKQMENLQGGFSWWGATGFTCALMIAGAASLIAISGGAALPLGAAIIATAGGTAGCGISIAGAVAQ